jgi:hypothetical protein
MFRFCILVRNAQRFRRKQVTDVSSPTPLSIVGGNAGSTSASVDPLRMEKSAPSVELDLNDVVATVIEPVAAESNLLRTEPGSLGLACRPQSNEEFFKAFILPTIPWRYGMALSTLAQKINPEWRIRWRGLQACLEEYRAVVQLKRERSLITARRRLADGEAPPPPSLSSSDIALKVVPLIPPQGISVNRLAKALSWNEADHGSLMDVLYHYTDLLRISIVGSEGIVRLLGRDQTGDEGDPTGDQSPSPVRLLRSIPLAPPTAPHVSPLRSLPTAPFIRTGPKARRRQDSHSRRSSDQGSAAFCVTLSESEKGAIERSIASFPQTVEAISELSRVPLAAVISHVNQDTSLRRLSVTASVSLVWKMGDSKTAPVTAEVGEPDAVSGSSTSRSDILEPSNNFTPGESSLCLVWRVPPIAPGDPLVLIDPLDKVTIRIPDPQEQLNAWKAASVPSKLPDAQPSVQTGLGPDSFAAEKEALLKELQAERAERKRLEVKLKQREKTLRRFVRHWVDGRLGRRKGRKKT